MIREGTAYTKQGSSIIFLVHKIVYESDKHFRVIGSILAASDGRLLQESQEYNIEKQAIIDKEWIEFSVQP